MDFTDHELSERAVTALRELVLFHLAPPRWEQVDGLLTRLDVAVTAHDEDALGGVVAELELTRNVRILRIGSEKVTPIPQRTLDRRNELVHRLTGEPTPKDDRDQRQSH
jgi:hypothetical protein